MMKATLCLIAPLVAALGCGQHAQERPKDTDYIVVEGGFLCPESLPDRFNLAAGDVCLPAGSTPGDLPSETCRLLGGCEEVPPGTEGEPPMQEVSAPVLLPPSSETLGFGPCASTSVGQVAERVRALYPELSGVDRFAADPLYGGPPPGEDTDHYLALVAEDAILLAFRRCRAETVTGNLGEERCTDEHVQFFETDATCTPEQSGEYRTTWTGDCYDVEGTVPDAYLGLSVPERERCDFEPMPEDVTSDRSYLALGMGSMCGEPIAYMITLRVSIEQNVDDPAIAVVTVSGSGHECLDGMPMQGEVVQSMVHATLSLDEAEGRSASDLCAPPAQLSFDLGTHPPPFVALVDYHTLEGDGCEGPPTYVSPGGFHLIPE